MNQTAVTSIPSLPPLLAVPNEPHPEVCSVCGGQNIVIRVLRGSKHTTTTWACGDCHPETVASGGTVYHYGDVVAIRKAITAVLLHNGEKAPTTEIAGKPLGQLCEVCRYNEAVMIWMEGKYYCETCKQNAAPVVDLDQNSDSTKDTPPPPAVPASVNKTSTKKVRTHHGVLRHGQMISLKGSWPVPTPLPTIYDVAEKAFECHLSHVWIPADIVVAVPDEKIKPWSIQINKRNGNSASISLWRGGWHVVLIFPHYSSWSWTKGCSVKELLSTIEHLETLLGVTVAGSASTCGWAYLKALHPEWIESIPVDWKALHFTQKASGDLIWRRRDFQPGMGRYLHKFDKNAAYPAAAVQTDIGTGQIKHLVDGLEADRASQHEKMHPQEVGVWRCDVGPAPADYPADMPPVWKNLPARDVWLMGPIIRLLRATGHEVTVYEGNVFSERHDLLTQWGKDLWLYRDTAPTKIKVAFKDISNKTIGLTGYKGFEDEEEEARRPDIRLQVIARNREILWHNIDKIRRVHNVTPLIVYMDAVYYLSDSPDGRTAFPELLKREAKLGGFKYEGYIDLHATHSYTAKNVKFDGRLYELLAGSLNEARKLEVLNDKGWVK